MSVPAGIRPPRSILLPVLGGIIVLAWIALWWLEQSRYGSLFHRHGGTAHAHHAQISGWFSGIAFLAGWLLMTIAMMLPTTVPLASMFRRMVRKRSSPPLLVALLVAGYLGAWLGFGLIALALLSGIDRLAANAAWFQSHAWLWSVALFLVAGAFQFSAIKYACLDKCRTPLGFLVAHWHGRREGIESFNIGWQHGVFCVGCCWALMLLMFAVGTASLAWMLVLALIMAVEKNMPWGRQLGRPLGAVLLAMGGFIGLYNLLI